MDRKLTAGLAAAAGLVAAAAAGRPASAALIAQYQFGAAGQETTAETGPAYAPTATAAGVTASPVADPANAVGIEVSSAATTPAGAPFLRVDPQGGSAGPAEAVANGKYFQFTITGAGGNTVSLTSLQFDAARGGGGTPRGYVVRSSLDNFAANLAQADLETARPTYTPVTVPLAGTVGSATFRVYSYSPGAGSSVDYDNVVLNGTVNVVPEPAGLAAAGVAAAAGLLARRHRRQQRA